MPFMRGEAPIRRTLKHLKAGKILFRDNVKIFSINYNDNGEHHAGARDFVFWHLSQIQYKNPTVQCVCFKKLTPSPFIKIFFDSGKSLLIDLDSRKREDILNHLANLAIVCKSRTEEREESSKNLTGKSNFAYFGYKCARHCLCEVLGQVPCPGVVPLPKAWRGIPDKTKTFRIPSYYMEIGIKNHPVDC